MMTTFKKKLVRGWRIAYGAILGFWEDDCYTKASTLTFYTIQSIVPFLAAMLAIAKGFGFDEYLEKLLTNTFVEQKEAFTYAIEMALKMLKFISSGEFVGIGVILLFYTNINLVGYIEVVLNQIWNVSVSRSFFQRIKDFSFAVLLFPLILVASSSTTYFIESRIHNISQFADINEIVVNEIKFLLPWMISCILFGTLYFIIPNTRVRIVPRLIASIIAGTAFQLWQWVFIKLQVYLFSYNVVYGAFALFPFFLIWLHFSWMIALAGAEISAFIENCRGYSGNLNAAGLAKVTPAELALLVMQNCMESFYSDQTPYTVKSFSARLGAPEAVLEKVLSVLEKNELVITFINKAGETCYHPLHDPTKIKVLQIHELIREDFDKTIIVDKSDSLDKISAALKSLETCSDISQFNISLGELFAG